MANPKLGSQKRDAYAVKAPEMGMYVAISPRATITEYTRVPTKAYAMSAPAGPAVDRAPPLPMKRPVPMVPPTRRSVSSHAYRRRMVTYQWQSFASAWIADVS